MSCPHCNGQIMARVSPSAPVAPRQVIPPPVPAPGGQTTAYDPLAFLATAIETPVVRKPPSESHAAHINQHWLLAIALSVLLLVIGGTIVLIIAGLNGEQADNRTSRSPTVPAPADRAQPEHKRPDVERGAVQPRAISLPNLAEPAATATKPDGRKTTANDPRVGAKPIPVDASALAAEFQENSNTAAEKFLTKTLELNGPVKEIVLDRAKDVITLRKGSERPSIDFASGRSDTGPIVVYDNGDKLWIVKCHFAANDETKTAIASIKAGDDAIIDGTCGGYGDNSLESVPPDGVPTNPLLRFGVIDIEACKLVSVARKNAKPQPARTEDAATILKNAAADWKKALAKANNDLIAAFEKAHKEAVAAHDGFGAQSVNADKNAFEQRKVYPRSKIMRPYLNDYLEQRADADGNLIAAFEKAMSVCKRNQEVAKLADLQREQKEFASSEEAIIDAIKKGDPLPTVAANTGEYLKRLSIRLRAQIDEIANPLCQYD